MNNFKELERQQSEAFDNAGKKIKKKLNNDISVFSFFGNVIDLYFSRMFNVMADLTSNDPSKESDNDDDENIDINALLS